jgi:general secretion pathway protein G
MRHLQRFISATSLSVIRICYHSFLDVLKNKKVSLAMTLVEVLTVVAMVGTLAAIGIPAYNNYLDRVRNEQAIEDIRFIEASVKMFLTNNGVLPNTLNQVASAQRRDPWNRPYQYLRIGGVDRHLVIGQWRKDRFLVPLNTDFDLYSTGKDGRSTPALTAARSRDDIVRANDGTFVGLASEY